MMTKNHCGSGPITHFGEAANDHCCTNRQNSRAAAAAPTTGTLILSSPTGTSSTAAQSTEINSSCGQRVATSKAMLPAILNHPSTAQHTMNAAATKASVPAMLFDSENGHLTRPHRLITNSNHTPQLSHHTTNASHRSPYLPIISAMPSPAAIWIVAIVPIGDSLPKLGN